MARQKSIEELLAELQGMQPTSAPPPHLQHPTPPTASTFPSLAAINTPSSRSAQPDVKMDYDASTTAKPDPVTAARDAASEITTWGAAVEHMMSLPELNPDLKSTVLALFNDQVDRCTGWEKGLEAENERIAARGGEGDRPPRGIANPGWHSHGMPWKYLEDVHSEALRMQRQQARKLAEIGIPFFGLRPSLIANDHEEGKVTPEELEDLEARMMHFLGMMIGKIHS